MEGESDDTNDCEDDELEPNELDWGCDVDGSMAQSAHSREPRRAPLSPCTSTATSLTSDHRTVSDDVSIEDSNDKTPIRRRRSEKFEFIAMAREKTAEVIDSFYRNCVSSQTIMCALVDVATKEANETSTFFGC